MALLVVVLALAKAVIDKEGGTANQTLAQGVDKCLALAVDFGQKIMRATDIHRRAQFGGTVFPGKSRLIAACAEHHAALMPLACGALQQLHRHGIQHLVADDHALHGVRQRIHPAHQMFVLGQRQLLARAQRSREIDNGVALGQRTLSRQLVEDLQRQRAGSRAELPDLAGIRFL